MNVFQSWANLGFNPDEVYLNLSNCPLSEKGQLAVQFLEKAKKSAKLLLAKYHPDKINGDQRKFLIISESIQIIEKETEVFLEEIKYKIKEKEMKKDKNAVFIEIG